MFKLSNVFCKWMAVKRRWEIVKRQTLKIATRHVVEGHDNPVSISLLYNLFLGHYIRFPIPHVICMYKYAFIFISWKYHQRFHRVDCPCLSSFPPITPSLTGINRDLKFYVFRISIFYIYLFSYASWQMYSDLMAKWN